MRLASGHLSLSPTDLASFLSCRRKTALDYAAARAALRRPRWQDDVLEVLRVRGAEHEQRHIAATRARGVDVVDLSHVDRRDVGAMTTATLDAMRQGAGAIVQAGLASGDGRWYGVADMLRRIESPSPNLGAWSYEALDTKLAQETRGATILQLSMYSDLVAETQGVRSEFFHVATPLREERYRAGDYAAYSRMMKSDLLAYLMALQDEHRMMVDPLGRLADHLPYPEPVTHCDVCDWRPDCRKQLRADDHLSFVANCSRVQRVELASQSITTLAVLGREGLPAGFHPTRGSIAVYRRLQHQARLQLESRDRNHAPVFEALPIEPGMGLCLLPDPSPGDVFLDLEGATWAREGGREYVFGFVTIDSDGAPHYTAFTAFDDARERAGFEQVIDRLIEAFDAHPSMHVYHYGAYEPAALKRLMGRYATCGPELDRLLRAERFVDLYGVVRHALRAGIESYSIKNLEAFYGFTREIALDEAGRCRRLVESALDRGAPEVVDPAELDGVVRYNRDDCVSTLRLRDWLESLRAAAVASGETISRPTFTPQEQSGQAGELERAARDVRARLLDGHPDDPSAWTEDQHARWLLAYTLDWHTREMKASWWEYYRLRDLPPEDLATEPMAVVGLQFVERVGEKRNRRTGRPTGTVVDRYCYADGQEMEIDQGDTLTLQNEDDWGRVAGVDRHARTIDVQKGPGMAERHPSSAFSFFHVSTDVIQRSVLAFGNEVSDAGLEAGPLDCRRELMLRRPPRLATTPFEPGAGESAEDFAVRIAPVLDRTVLAIQGPPGTGKTYTGARIVCELVRAGKRVGVTATSHKVIRNLLKGVVKEAGKTRQPIRVVHKTGSDDEESDDAGILELRDTGRALASVREDHADVLGGVAWTFASDSAVDLLDALVVDEAGQMSLANVLGAARAAKSLVLLGDQQQLEQPRKASHPDGVNVSALDHVLAGRRTMPRGQGVFLPNTRRLAPAIAAFTSEAFYEGRLGGLPELRHQRLTNPPPFDAGGLWVLPVEHTGNRSYSLEEVEAIAMLVERLLTSPAFWIDSGGQAHRITGDDILVVSPYNAQVSRLRRRFDARPPGLGVPRVGTVDRFQGQEAPVAIYSMATSRAEDAPRGMEFLYSLNRLNVATSRARCAVVVVGSPALFAPVCSTPRQMQLASAMCLYREMAHVLA
jgi:uncharacterized protein